MGHEQWGLVGKILTCHLWGPWARLRLGYSDLPAAMQDASHASHLSQRGDVTCLNRAVADLGPDPRSAFPAGPPPLSPQPGRVLQAAQSETQVSWGHSEGRFGAFRFSF